MIRDYSITHVEDHCDSFESWKQLSEQLDTFREASRLGTRPDPTGSPLSAMTTGCIAYGLQADPKRNGFEGNASTHAITEIASATSRLAAQRRYQ
jgi:hypothetical protein